MLNAVQIHGHICDPGLPFSELIHSDDTHLNHKGDRGSWKEETTRSKEQKPITGPGARRLAYVRVEMETFRRLPRSRFILFTVRTYQDKLRHIERAPVAAQAMAAAVRRAHKGLLHYHQLATGFEKGILEYLDAVTESAGLLPFKGVVPEPWEREPPEDGSWALEAERSLRSAGSHPMAGSGTVLRTNTTLRSRSARL